MQENFKIGQIVNTMGLKGFVKVIPFTDNVKRFEKLKTVYLVKEEALKEIEIEEVKYNNKFVLIKFKGIEDINKAETLRGLFIQIDRKDAVKLPKDSYFMADLIGLEVYTTDNELLGRVDDVFSTKSNDVYVVKNELGKQILVPAVKTIIKEINLSESKIIINLIEGLI